MTKRFLYLATLWAIIFIIICSALHGQETFNREGALSLRTNQTEVRPGQLTSNVVRVVNNTNTSGEFSLQIDVPGGWQVIGETQRNFTMQAGDTLFFPIRVIAYLNIQTPEPQVINVSLRQFRNIVAADNWTIMPILNSDWNFSVSRSLIVVPDHVNEVSFTMDIINTGDLREFFTLDMELSRQLALLDKQGNVVENTSAKFSLSPLQDTTITVWVRILEEQNTSSPSPVREEKRVRVSVDSEGQTGEARSRRANIDIKQLADQQKHSPTSYYSIPLSLEFNAYDLLSENTYGDLLLYGNHYFNAETHLSYFFQANFISNFFNPQAFLGQYLNINFRSRYFGVELGNVSLASEGASISGEGAKVEGMYENHRLSAGYVRAPGVFRENPFSQGMGLDYSYLGRTVRGGAFGQVRENFNLKTDELLAGANLSYRFAGSQFIRASGNFTRQTHNWNPDSIFTVEGMGYRIRYSGRYDRLGYGFAYGNSSSTNLIRRGVESMSARASWRFNPRQHIAFSFSQHSSEPEYYHRGVLREMLVTRKRQNFQLNYQLTGETSSFSLVPSHSILEDRLVSYSRSGTEMNYRLLQGQDLRFSAGAFAGYTSFSDTLDDLVFISLVRTNIRYFQYNLNVRYYYGPYLRSDVARFAESQRISNRLAATFFFDNYFANNSIMLRFSSLYNYSTYNNQSSLSLRPELYYFLPSGLRFGVYGRYYGLSVDQDDLMGLPDLTVDGSSYSSSRYEFGFNIKKSLNVPVSGKRFFDLTVVVYRDVSGSGNMRSGDPGVPEVWIRMQPLEPAQHGETVTLSHTGNFEAITNDRGSAFFVNIPPGSYLLTLVPVAQSGSRFDARTYEVMVSEDRTLYLSIDRGARVAGSIILHRDQYTMSEYFPVDNIRVTATNEDGQQFSTLTNNNGNYSLYLQKGNYTVSVNEGIFTDPFTLQENNIPIEVMHEHEVITVNFTATERTRQIRIQQPDNNNQQNPQPDEPQDENSTSPQEEEEEE